jgi:hypothetical protein
MKEEFLHFIYKHKLWKNDSLILNSGKSFEIIDTGLPNYDAGPDFFNAKIKIEDKIWIGNVEIHVNSSDWFKHRHDRDLSYKNVILHIVFNQDKPVYYSSGEEIPTWEIKFDHSIYNKYSEWSINKNLIACSDYIDMVDEFKIQLWLEKMAVERLIKKTEYIQLLLDKCNNNWEQAFYISLARNFGFSVNSFPFEQLAFATSINILRKYFDNLFQIEAILFGQSGLLPEKSEAKYVNELIKEYKFLRHKHKLLPMPGELWKKARIRPSNFPHVRIAQFAKLLTNFQGLFAEITQESNLGNLKKIFEIKPSEYWKIHYNFDAEVQKANTKFGEEAFNILMINTIVPFKYFYLKNFKNDNSEYFALDLFNEIKAEDNRDIRAWKSLNIIPTNAFVSQALINLKKDYCELKKCMDCSIGYEIMKKISKL